MTKFEHYHHHLLHHWPDNGVPEVVPYYYDFVLLSFSTLFPISKHFIVYFVLAYLM